jgi:hypothetical protein
MGSAAACRYCGVKIRWVETEAGRRMPVNLDPDPNGNVVMVAGLARVLGVPELVAQQGKSGRWMPHHATCTGKPRTRRRSPGRVKT